jgi:glycosyltransferase 2 family protein
VQNFQNWKKWLFPVQVIVSIGLIYWIIQRISWRESLDVLLSASLLYIIIACLNYYISVIVSCMRWKELLKIENLSIPLPLLVRWYLIGSFANNLLPTDVGGDIGRIYYANRYAKNPKVITRSVILDRVSGFIVMIFFAWLGLFFIANQQFLAIAILVFLVLVLMFIFFLRKMESCIPTKIKVLLQYFIEIFNYYAKRPKSVYFILTLSVLFHFMAGFGAWINLKAVYVDIPFFIILLVSAFANVLAALPISLNGLGLKEAAYIWLIGSMYASESQIFAGLVLGRLLLLLVSLAGLVFILMELKIHTKPQSS